MDKYKQAAAKLTPAKKAEMNQEYQQMKAKGKLAFTSTVTGLDYTIPENAKSTKPAPKSAFANNEFMNKVMGVTQPKPVNIRTDKGVPAPKAKEVGVPEKYTPSISRSSTAVASNPQERILSDLDKAVAAYDKGKSPAEVAAINKVKADAGNRPKFSAKEEPTEKKSTSYLPTVKNVLGSTTLARAMSEITNMYASKALKTVDKALGTNLDSKELLGMNTTGDDYSAATKSLLAKMAYGEHNRTGANKGSITYEDAKAYLSKEDYQALMKAKTGEYGIVDKAKLSLGSVGVDYGTTVGGASWSRDPKTNKVTITDKWDANNDDNTKRNKDGDLEFKPWLDDATMSENKKSFFRGAFGHDKMTKYDVEVANKNRKANTEELANRNVSIEVSPKDTVGRASDKNASLIAKYFYDPKYVAAKVEGKVKKK